MDPAKLTQEADSLRNNGQGLAAVEKYKEAAAEYEALNQDDKAADCWHMVGVSYKVENDIDNAVTTLSEASQKYEKLGDAVGIGRVDRDIGIAEAYRYNYREAIEWLLKSEWALRGAGNNAELGITEAKLGLMYLRIKQLGAAEEWMLRGLSTIRKDPHWFYEMTTLLHLAELKFTQQNYKVMKEHLDEGFALLKESGQADKQARREAQFEGLFAQAELGEGNVEPALKHYSRSRDLLKGMAKNVSKVIREDIMEKVFLSRLKKQSPGDFERLQSS